MQKSAPSVGRILIAGGFALSCFGLLLFLWVAFGGPVPLKPKSYRVTAYFPEAVQLATEADVRIGGVSVGKVKTTELAPPDQRIDGQDLTEAEIELEPEFAPLNTDTKAILRQKTLLGETYVELTSGTDPEDADAPVSLGAASSATDAEVESSETLPEEGTIPTAQVATQTQIDDIFNALDEETRLSFQRWQQNSAVAINERGQDLNDAIGNLGPFLDDASLVLSVLRRQKASLKGLVRDTGETFEALTERGDQLRTAITGSNEVFDALASEDEALAETFQVLPAFQQETRRTFERLDDFQENTRPLIRQLQPVADDLSPTLRSVRRLSPNLVSLFRDLDDLIRVSKRGLPALGSFIDGLGPVLRDLDPFLANLNPVIGWLEYYKSTINNFLTNPAAGLAGSLPPEPGQPAARFSLAQLGYITPETLAVYDERLDTNRGNGYIKPLKILEDEGRIGGQGAFHDFDCDHIGGEVLRSNPRTGARFSPCFLQDDFPNDITTGKMFPQVVKDGPVRTSRNPGGSGGSGGGGGQNTGGSGGSGGGGGGAVRGDDVSRSRGTQNPAGSGSAAITGDGATSENVVADGSIATDESGSDGSLPFSGLALGAMAIGAGLLLAVGLVGRRFVTARKL